MPDIDATGHQLNDTERWESIEHVSPVDDGVRSAEFVCDSCHLVAHHTRHAKVVWVDKIPGPTRLEFWCKECVDNDREGWRNAFHKTMKRQD